MFQECIFKPYLYVIPDIIEEMSGTNLVQAIPCSLL